MPKRKLPNRVRTRNLKNHEKAFLFDNEQYLTPGSRLSRARYLALKNDTGPLMFGDRSRDALLSEFPQYAQEKK